jgi:hypothetical protein
MFGPMRSGVNWIGAGHRRVIELVDDVEPRSLGEPLDRDPLPAIVVLALADVSGAGAANIANSQFPRIRHSLSCESFCILENTVSASMSGPFILKNCITEAS